MNAYVVMMKCLRTETVSPVSVFQDYDTAEAWMNAVIDENDDCGFKIETVTMNPSTTAF